RAGLIDPYVIAGDNVVICSRILDFDTGPAASDAVARDDIALQIITDAVAIGADAILLGSRSDPDAKFVVGHDAHAARVRADVIWGEQVVVGGRDRDTDRRVPGDDFALVRGPGVGAGDPDAIELGAVEDEYATGVGWFRDCRGPVGIDPDEVARHDVIIRTII